MKSDACQFREKTRFSYNQDRESAFALMDVLFILAAIALLIATTLPSLGNNRTRSERLVCANNLRQIGVAFQQQADAFDDRVPWQVPVAEGGTGRYPNPLIDNPWYHFMTISNLLSSPSLLACPSDNARVASRWDFGDGGLLNPSFRNNSLSYLIGCHAELALPLSVLSADRNIIPDRVGSQCSVGFTAVNVISRAPTTQVAWNSTNLHAGDGNLLLMNGTVLELSSPGLRNYSLTQNLDSGADHYSLPR